MNFLKNEFFGISENINLLLLIIRDTFSRLRQFLTTESSLKMMKNAFHFTLNSPSI